jgi:hypothetical protein
MAHDKMFIRNGYPIMMRAYGSDAQGFGEHLLTRRILIVAHRRAVMLLPIRRLHFGFELNSRKL